MKNTPQIKCSVCGRIVAAYPNCYKPHERTHSVKVEWSKVENASSFAEQLDAFHVVIKDFTEERNRLNRVIHDLISKRNKIIKQRESQQETDNG